jgi:hypothetical protein
MAGQRLQSHHLRMRIGANTEKKKKEKDERESARE